MSKATTTAALQSAALKEFSARNQRYWSASSLPTREKVKHRKPLKAYRRDRVMNAILRRDINRKIEVARNEIIASIGGKKS
ncbi:hypothetical protein ACNZAM_004060 [Cronobacter malonaticus]|uniref:DUF7301 family protein n=1 Tax=Cronobacter sakazakii TaxID=28141 RepID=UPI000CFB3247|nr:hypothetical protein [Cronobacter sakazakii]EKK4014454.1 hypothetical protein [Cronobacter sakazakii]ELY6200928.1 hypothetical protein [Cronobacter sakazakii]EMD7609167.1 hypothetical protein [Cronobacter sakazakii]PQY12808.1 hypothetical protein C5957_22170 [Cronobacter sakazakii]HAU5455666.1 hypothetical protein [Cronobacter sakazakii]